LNRSQIRVATLTRILTEAVKSHAARDRYARISIYTYFDSGRVTHDPYKARRKLPDPPGPGRSGMNIPAPLRFGQQLIR